LLEFIRGGRSIMPAFQEHDPEKACPGLDPGRKPGFGQDHAQTNDLESDPIQLKWMPV
jgi:hypothetical protein